MNEEYKNFVAELYERNITVLYNIAYLYIKNDADAQDMAEDVFVIALKKAKLLYKHENPDGWLYKTLYFKIKEYYRNKKYDISQEDLELLFTEDFDMHDMETKIVDNISFYEFLRTLPVRERKYIVYRYMAGMKIQEISEKLGLSQGAVKQLWFRAKKKLKKILKKP